MLSAPIVITGPTGDVLELDTAKLFLRIDGDDLDTEVRGYIAAAVSDIESMTSTRLAEQVVEIRADRFDDLAHLQIGPVQSVVSIAYEDVAGVTQSIAADQYELTGAGLERGIRARFGVRWPTTRFASGTIVVHLQVGYPVIPPTLGLALLLAIRGRFEATAVDLWTLTLNDRIWM